MIRVVVFFALVAVLALGAAWIADRPGEIAITWQGWRIETSVMVGAAAVAILVALAMMVWSILRLILRTPDFVSLALRNRRENRRHQAISRGLIAIGAGDAKGARRYADEAARLGADDPLALLLRAQTAQLNGDREGAARAFRAMADRGETRLIGLRGLFIEAQRRDDVEAARLYAAEAAQAAPALEWAGQALLDHQCAAGDWAGALRTLENNARHGLIDKPAYRRQRAVLLTAQALAAEAQDDRQTARTLATEAARLAPDLVPAAALAGRLLAEAGELRRAAKVVEAAWRREPHPDLAEIYTHLRSGDSARDRLARMQTLLRQSPGGDEGALALARAAIDAQDFATARRALEPLLAQPTQRTALLMAELEDAEHGDAGRAREWMARALRAGRDPAWTADGLVSDHWLPVSPVSGRLDAFQWKVPVAALHEGAVLEAPIAPAVLIEPRPPAPPAEAEANPAEAAEPVTPAEVDPPASVVPAPAAAEPSAEPSLAPAPATGDGGAPIRHAAARREAPVEAVIPLIHAPDDPGPEPDLDPDARRGMGRTLLQ
jgi:HemY protein